MSKKGDSAKAGRGKSKKDKLDDPKLSIVKTYLCGDCNKTIIENADNKEDESIECTICTRWYHRGCTPLSPQVFDIMSTSDNVKYFCPQCEDCKGKEKKELKVLMDMINNMEDKIMKKMESVIDLKVDLKVKEIEKSLEDKFNEKLNSISVSNIETKIKDQVEQSLGEQKEIESKANNLIIFNIAESEGSETEKLEKDINIVKELIGTTSPELTNEGNNINQNNIQRLGKANPQTNKTRPIKIQLPDESFKNNLLKNARKLRNTTKFKNVFLKNDLTKRQQQQEYDLRKEKKDRLLNGEDVIIYNDKVILRSLHPNFDPSRQRHFDSSNTLDTKQSA